MNPATLTSKKVNKKNILNYIITHENVTRIKLTSELGLSAGTITNIVTELISQNLLLESSDAYYKRGRKTKFLKFNGDFAYVVCVEMSIQNELIITVCNLLGEKVAGETIHIAFSVTRERPIAEVIRLIISSIHTFLEKLDKTVHQKLCALAVSIGGMMDAKNLVDIPICNWRSVNLTVPLQAAIHLPVYIDNVTRIKSVYEVRYIEAAKNVIYLNMSPGIGIAHYFDGKLICGKNGISGEAGHMTLNVDGEKCYCGNYGCFELYCGHQAILDRARREIGEAKGYDILQELVHTQGMPLNLDTLSQAHKLGSVYVNELFMETGKYLGCGIANLYNIFDPDLLIVSGYGTDSDPFILEVAQAEARSRIVNTFRREMRMKPALLKKEEGYKAINAYVLKDKLDEFSSR
ncbi:MAG: ROK family transcriptional regulator [Lachnospiraceae bacterium]|nr:ROK family transcriptional regulator [Lachnospiraceae bacterium]